MLNRAQLKENKRAAIRAALVADPALAQLDEKTFRVARMKDDLTKVWIRPMIKASVAGETGEEA